MLANSLSPCIITAKVEESRDFYVPPKVEYSLTEFGKTLEPVLKTLQGWGVKYLEQITQIRKERA